ncbi:MAG: phage portal protein, partial [Planctomycetaceae bacterium]|nr:phage portal protein [Planctomycetaceae bacterium]
IGQTIAPFDRAEISAKARYEYLNNDHFCGIVRSFAINIVGTGPRLVFNVDHLIEDRTDKILNRKARDVCGEVERRFHNWLDEINYFAEQYTGMISMILDGEMLGVWNYNPKIKFCPYVYRSIDVSRLCNPNNQQDTESMQGGILYDTWGNPEYYCILDLPENPNYGYNYGKYQLVPAQQICHFFIPEFAEQTRGFSLSSQALNRIAGLRDFEDATLEGAKNAASIVGTIWTEQGYGNSKGISESFIKQQWESNSTFPINRNTWMLLPPKAKGDIFPSKPSNVEHNSYVNNSLTALAHPFGMPKNQATNTSDDYNFSSAKLDLLNSQRIVEFIRKLISQKMNTPCFEKFWSHNSHIFYERYAHDGIEYIPDEDNLNIKWRYPIPPEIEPWKREEMFKTMQETGTASTKDILEMRGSDFNWYDLMDQKATEDAYQSEMGQSPVEINTNQQPTPNPTADSQPNNLEQTALNGAQVTAAVDIVVKVTTKELPPESAKVMLMQFFQLPESVASQMINAAQQMETPLVQGL